MASGDWPKLIVALKSPTIPTLTPLRNEPRILTKSSIHNPRAAAGGTRYTWSLHLVCLSQLESGTPTATARSSQGPPRRGRDTGPFHLLSTLTLYNWILFWIHNSNPHMTYNTDWIKTSENRNGTYMVNCVPQFHLPYNIPFPLFQPVPLPAMEALRMVAHFFWVLHKSHVGKLLIA